MDQSTILALTVAGVLTPWIIEVAKLLFGDTTGKKSLTLALVVSLLDSVGVLWYQHKLIWADPTQLMASIGLVLGISTTVYQYIQHAVESPVNVLKGMLSK